MTTWAELLGDRPHFGREQRDERGCEHVPKGTGPLGTGPHTFAERLNRARLLYARRREAMFNWLALSVAMLIVLAAPSIEDRCADTAPEMGMRCLQATEIR